MKIQSMSFPIAGADHYQHSAPLKQGVELELRREPENAYDPNAVSVWYGDKLGYIPRPMAVMLAPMIDSGQVTVVAFYEHGIAIHLVITD